MEEDEHENEQKPQWYDLARKGPLQDKKFTEAAADSVVRQLQPGGSTRSQAVQTGRRRMRIRTRILSAAVILLIAGAGVLHLGSDGFGHSGGYNPLKAVSAGIFDPPVAGQAVLSDAGLQEIAEQVMQEQLGKKLPILFLERLKEPEEGIAAVHCKEGEDSAVVWIDTATGQVIRTNMTTYYTPEEIDPEFIEEALGHLREAGYKGGSSVTGLKHFLYYGLDSGREGVQATDSLIGTEAQVDYMNGVYHSSTFSMSEDETSAEVKQAGLKAIKLLREQGTDHLYSIKRTVAQKWDVLVLTYGESEQGATTVLMDYATQAIIQVSDYTLNNVKSSDSKIQGEQDTNLLNMDKTKLQASAAAIADEMFGIRLKDYTVAEEMSSPGTIAFKSPDGATVITGLYNLDGVFYMIQQTDAVE